MSAQAGFVIAIFVGWAIAFSGMRSVLHHSFEDFQKAGFSKKWCGRIQLLGVIPYVGLFTATWYAIRVRPHLPPPQRQTRRSTSTASQASAGSTSRISGTASARQRCGGGCSNGRLPCYGCHGGWVEDSQGRTVAHAACGGRGSMTCQMCNGSGYRYG
jgi:hypothetical protein